jgi:O-antigen ligase
LWALRLLRPDWLIAGYVYGLGHLKKIQTLFLIALALIWLSSSNRSEHFKLFALFLASAFISTLFAENTGLPRIMMRQLFEFYLLAGITLAFAKNLPELEKIFDLLVAYFAYYAIWGIIGNGKVNWDVILNEEDAYGPLMCIGFAYCYQYSVGQPKNMKKYIAFGTSALCAMGVVLSFARGAFLCLCATVLMIWWKSEKKVRGTAVVIIATLAVLAGANTFFPENQYWQEIRSITDEGSGSDRKILWKIAWYEFLDNPIIGVGPYNFGIAGVKYATRIPEGERGRYEDPVVMWGRAIHNAYFQILSEQGSVGVLVLLLILLDFWRKNSAIQKLLKGKTILDSEIIDHKKYYGIGVGLQIAVVAFLMNAFFYDIIYYPWFWNFIILNRALNFVLQEMSASG